MNEAGDISLGAEVVGVDGKLGSVDRFIADARSEHVTDLVVKRGVLHGNDRVVPLGHVTRVEAGCVRVDLDTDGFEAMNGFSDDVIHAADPDYVGPPGFDQEGSDRGNMALDQAVALGSSAGLGSAAKVMGYPGGEELTPQHFQRPVIAGGTDVLDSAGEKVGEVGGLNVTAGNGSLTQVILRQGLLFKHDTELPLAWVAKLSDLGVMLNVPKHEVEALAERN